MFLSVFLPSVSLLICFNFDAGILTMHDGKGKKDRTVPIPQVLVPELKRQLRIVATIHEADLQTKYAGAFLPDQLERKYKAELLACSNKTYALWV